MSHKLCSSFKKWLSNLHLCDMPKEATWSEECFGTLLARASSPKRTVAGWEGGSYLSGHRPEVKAPSRSCFCVVS